jgi:hypothetical protein
MNMAYRYLIDLVIAIGDGRFAKVQAMMLDIWKWY